MSDYTIDDIARMCESGLRAWIKRKEGRESAEEDT